MHHNNHMCKKITTSLTTSRISTFHSNQNRRERVVETSKGDEEEVLVEGEFRFPTITMDNQVTMLDIS